MNNLRIARLCRDTKKVDIVIPRISSEYNQYVYGWVGSLRETYSYCESPTPVVVQ